MGRWIIDAHTHAFPPEVVERRAHYIEADFWFGQLYANPNAKLTTEVELLASMDEVGVAMSVICGFPWSDPGLCREHNAWMADVRRHHPNRLAYLAIVVPDDHAAARDAEDAFAAGAAGIGELNADGQGFDLQEPARAMELMELCRLQGRPVMFHSSEPLGHGYPGKGSATPDRLLTWLRCYPEQPIILAHWGGGLPFYELMPEVWQATRNVFYDSAASTYLYRGDVFDLVPRLVGHDRVLFGSDFPVLGQRRLVNKLVREFGEHQGFEPLMAGNAARVFGLDRASQ